MTPAGTHVPIMVNECLHYMGLTRKNDDSTATEIDDEKNANIPLLVIDCTLGYGGHSSYILKHLVDRIQNGASSSSSSSSSRLIAFDQDSAEIKKTEERLQNGLTELGQRRNITINTGSLFTAVNQNFQTAGEYLSSTDQSGKVTSLLADLGLSSMQIDDNDRGFTYKRDGPLDMRMNPEDDTAETAHDLLKRLRVRKLKSMLRENSDEEFAAEIADGIIGKGVKIPETTIELADRVREIARPLIEKQYGDKRLNRRKWPPQRKKSIRPLLELCKLFESKSMANLMFWKNYWMICPRC